MPVIVVVDVIVVVISSGGGGGGFAACVAFASKDDGETRPAPLQHFFPPDWAQSGRADLCGVMIRGHNATTTTTKMATDLP